MYPFEFEMLWQIRVNGPLTAGEISTSLNMRRPTWSQTTPIGVSNQMRGLLRRGFLEHDNGRGRIYRLTPRGRELVDA